jgi:glycosyltransferase involved in cell wall biosynthesis
LLERALAKRLPVVFDFDDAIYLRQPSLANGYFSLLKFPGKTRTICRLASHVLAGNRNLAAYASRYNDNVSVVPSTMDLSKYTYDAAASSPSQGPVVIGWTGSHSTIPHLDTIRAALRHVADTEPVRLKVIGATAYELPGVDVEARPWVSATEVDDLRPIDIGVMPLPDDEWSRGKCAAKALQYMALGIPTVCSPVGVNADIVSHRLNGLLASTESDWVDCLTELVRSPDLRLRLGREGRATVERDFTATTHARRAGEIFRTVVTDS